MVCIVCWSGKPTLKYVSRPIISWKLFFVKWRFRPLIFPNTIYIEETGVQTDYLSERHITTTEYGDSVTIYMWLYYFISLLIENRRIFHNIRCSILLRMAYPYARSKMNDQQGSLLYIWNHDIVQIYGIKWEMPRKMCIDSEGQWAESF